MVGTERDGLKYVCTTSTSGRNSWITCQSAIRQTSLTLTPLMSTSLFSSSPSSPTDRIPIVTVTILSPSATSQAQPTNSNDRTAIPIGSIVGGCLAGVILAVAAVVGWHLWGRSIKRKEEAKRQADVRLLFICLPDFILLLLPQMSHHTTVRNTRLNALATFQPSYTPPFRNHTQDRKVKFAAQESDTQYDKINQLPALYHASLPARPSPLSQSAVGIEQSIVK